MRILIIILLFPLLAAGQNKRPTANAGRDTIIYYPDRGPVMLLGLGTDPEKGALKFKWTRLPEIVSTQGNAFRLYDSTVFHYELTVTDNKGATGKDTVRVTLMFLDYGINSIIDLSRIGSWGILNSGEIVPAVFGKDTLGRGHIR